MIRFLTLLPLMAFGLISFAQKQMFLNATLVGKFNYYNTSLLNSDGTLSDISHHYFKSNGIAFAIEKPLNSYFSNEIEIMSFVDRQKYIEEYKGNLTEKWTNTSVDVDLIYKLNFNILGGGKRIQPIISPVIIIENRYFGSMRKGADPRYEVHNFTSIQPGISSRIVYLINETIGIEFECPIIINVTSWQNVGSWSKKISNKFWPNIYYFKVGIKYSINRE